MVCLECILCPLIVSSKRLHIICSVIWNDGTVQCWLVCESVTGWLGMVEWFSDWLVGNDGTVQWPTGWEWWNSSVIGWSEMIGWFRLADGELGNGGGVSIVLYGVSSDWLSWRRHKRAGSRGHGSVFWQKCNRKCRVNLIPGIIFQNGFMVH